MMVQAEGIPRPTAEILPARHLAFLGAGVSLVVLVALLHRFYEDDAYTTLRYARNLLEGHGLVWNPGERVEGYTSLLWVLACAALGWIGVDLELASRLLGFGSLLALLIMMGRQPGRAGALACLLIATTGPMIAWSIGGLETVGYAFLLTAAFLSTERLLNASEAPSAHEAISLIRAFCAGALFGLAELCRPEALLFFTVFALMWGRRIIRTPRHRGPFGAFLLAFAMIFVARLAWRLSYYGDLLPNTFAVKVAPRWSDVAAGMWYTASFVLWWPALTMAALWAIVANVGRRLSQGERAALVACGLYLMYVVSIGGDHMRWFRFVVPVLPMCALLVARWLESNCGGLASPRAQWGGLILLLCGLNFGSTLALTDVRGWTRPDSAADHGRLVGLYIRDHWPSDSLVALNTAGSTPYFSRLRSIDMLGLNDRTIARRHMPSPPIDLPWARMPGHGKGDGAYVLSRHPDYIILGGSEGYAYPWFIGDKELVESAAFPDRYVLRQTEIRLPDEAGPLVFRYFESRAHELRSGRQP